METRQEFRKIAERRSSWCITSRQELLQLPHHKHFPHVVPSQEELDGGEVAEQSLDVSVVEDTLQAKAVDDRRVNGSSRSAAGFAAHHDALHLKRIFFDDVEAITGRIRTGIFRVKKR